MKVRNMIQGPYVYFGIIDILDEHRDYSKFRSDESFEDKLNEHHCVSVPDDIINNWWEKLLTMKSYYHEYSRLSTALARWGITLIPPESLDLFHDIIISDTSSEFFEKGTDDVNNLLALVEKAKKENKFVIHYGV